MTEVEKKLEEAQARLLEFQTEIVAQIGRARGLLQQAADEHRRLRHEAENVNLKVYDEAQAARELLCGESTLRRLRTSHPGAWPCFYIGNLVRYTNFHLVEITEILDRRKAKARGKK